jgi:hypothetical protein
MNIDNLAQEFGTIATRLITNRTRRVDFPTTEHSAKMMRSAINSADLAAALYEMKFASNKRGASNLASAIRIQIASLVSNA